MIILLNPWGQYSNRLTQEAYYQSICWEYKIKYLSLANPEMIGLYRQISLTNNLLINILGKIIIKIIRKLLLLLLRIGYIKCHSPKNINSLLKLSKRNYFLFVGGWGFAKDDKWGTLVKKYTDRLRIKYRVAPERLLDNEQSILKKINYYKENKTILIGLHIRRGDYRTWQNGKYFYPDDVWTNCIEKIAHYNKNQKFVFVLFSNEEITIKLKYKHIVSTARWHVDHYLMSLCDYIIGPPSTFPLWAALHSAVKIHWIDSVMNDKNYSFIINKS
ncbi:MAG: alpha-1,2-fucosyltransferase [Hydrotalea sp.]|nr:alpha-1,2-fucosyltransferase [Hydrotalea sp.]